MKRVELCDSFSSPWLSPFLFVSFPPFFSCFLVVLFYVAPTPRKRTPSEESRKIYLKKPARRKWTPERKGGTKTERKKRIESRKNETKDEKRNGRMRRRRGKRKRNGRWKELIERRGAAFDGRRPRAPCVCVSVCVCVCLFFTSFWNPNRRNQPDGGWFSRVYLVLPSFFLFRPTTSALPSFTAFSNAVSRTRLSNSLFGFVETGSTR